MGKKRIDLTGQKFGRLVVISLNEEVSKQKKCSYWNCKCDCGNETIVLGKYLRKGNTQSCGCYKNEKTRERWKDEGFREKQKEAASKFLKDKWEDDNFREAQSVKSSKRLKEKWEDEEFRQMKTNEIKERWQDEEHREFMRNIQSANMKLLSEKQWKDEEYREFMHNILSASMKERWKDEEFKRMRSEEASKQMKELWKNEEYRQIKSDELKARWESDSYRQYMTNKTKELWENEEYRQYMANKLKEYWHNEEHRQEQRDKLTEIWKDEELRQKQRNKLKEFWGNNEARRKEYSEKFSGENSPAYNPNLTDEDRQDRRNLPGYEEWKQQVKEQANYICDCCGKRGGKLESHHKDGYNWCKERRMDIANGVCLCEACHKEFHKKHGKGNNTEQQYIEFKEEKQKNVYTNSIN